MSSYIPDFSNVAAPLHDFLGKAYKKVEKRKKAMINKL